MGADRTRVLRGALAGAVAAGVWAAQSPLDRRLFGVDYDDSEFLGSLVTHRRGGVETYAVGTALHVANGALFGAAYSALAPSLGVPGALRGLAAGLGEHLATWPGTRFFAAWHPVGSDLPRLWGDRRAFAQATWRHALFGIVLGELERRLNPPAAEAAPAGEDRSSSNGHGNVEHLVTARAI
jgi:hypothetical protein